MNVSSDDLAVLRSDVFTTGFACVENAIDEALLEKLRAEAELQKKNALSVSDDGLISYQAYLSDLGAVAREFLTDQSVTDFLQLLFGQSFVLSEGSCCYTYYNVGDFIKAHRDVASDCEVTVLLYLEAASPDPDAADSGLSLQIYDDHEGKPTDIRHTIKTRRGFLVTGRGSSEWHGRPPLLEGEHIALISACFISND